MLRAKFRCSLHGRLECANFGASAKTATEGRMLWRPLSFSGHSFQLVPSSLRVPVSGTRKQFSSVTFASRERPNFARIARKTPPPKFRKTLRETLAQGNPPAARRARLNERTVGSAQKQQVATHRLQARVDHMIFFRARTSAGPP